MVISCRSFHLKEKSLEDLQIPETVYVQQLKVRSAGFQD